MLDVDVTVWSGVVGVVSITCRGGTHVEGATALSVLNVGSRWAKQSSLSTSAPYFLLYCVYSPIYSFEWYLSFSPFLFLGSIFLTARMRF
jgi:hypothetical protein